MDNLNYLFAALAMDNLNYLFAAYTIIWAVIFGYVFFMHQRHRRLQRELDLLKEDVDEQKMD